MLYYNLPPHYLISSINIYRIDASFVGLLTAECSNALASCSIKDKYLEIIKKTRTFIAQN